MSAECKTPVGIQGSVMGWDDPWHYKLCETMMRTGERMAFPSQDDRPDVDTFLLFLKALGADFYVHHAMPDETEIQAFIESMKQYDMPYFLGNEYGNINRPNNGQSNRYDFPVSDVLKATKTGKLLGLIYDETEHLQLHPEIYAANNKKPEDVPLYQWTSADGKTLQEIEDDVVDAVSSQLSNYGDVSAFSEQVFPVMYHTLARGGMNPCPKVLKEEFQSLQLATALGAAKEYGRKMGICVDLWGQDVGSWFTRVWGFPGHSPREFKSGLEMAYLFGPDFLFVENVDCLTSFQNRAFTKTEYGDVFEEFVKKFIPTHPRHYTHSMANPDIAVIRSDDTDINSQGGPFGRGLYGSKEIYSDNKTQSVFQVFHLLSHGSIPINGVTFFLPQYEYHAARFQRTPDMLRRLPLTEGVEKAEQTSTHTLFFPMNNVVVYDEKVSEVTLGNPKLIILAGSRMTDACFQSVLKRVKDGAVCVAAKWLIPKWFEPHNEQPRGQWVITEDFLSDGVREAITPFIGEKGCWRQRFGDYNLRLYNQTGDGISLEHNLSTK